MVEEAGWRRCDLTRGASSQPVASTAVVAAVVMAAIPVVTVEVRSEVTLMVPPPIVMEEERREAGSLPCLAEGCKVFLLCQS